jgi:hypothetical protein
MDIDETELCDDDEVDDMEYGDRYVTLVVIV